MMVQAQEQALQEKARGRREKDERRERQEPGERPAGERLAEERQEPEERPAEEIQEPEERPAEKPAKRPRTTAYPFIVAHPFEEYQITDCEGIREVNEHARLWLSGEIPFEKRDGYLKLGKQPTWVRVTVVSQDSEQTLFYGIIGKMVLEVKGHTCGMRLSLVSGTALMDYKKHTRSFQSASLTFGGLLDTCNRGYDNSSKIMTSAKGQAIGQFIMQYEETDWAFMKRLASMNHTVLVADCSTQGEKYYFGLPKRKGEGIAGMWDDYRLESDMEGYWRKRSLGLPVSPQDTLVYIWESGEAHKLGDCCSVERRQLFVWKIETRMEGRELIHTCYMKPRKGFHLPEMHRHISGASLPGEVKGVKDGMVQIELFQDENKWESGKCWFAFAASNPSTYGINGIDLGYTPAIGDKVRLCFPTDRDSDAYVEPYA